MKPTFVCYERLNCLPKCFVFNYSLVSNFLKVLFYSFSSQVHTEMSLLFISNFVFIDGIFIEVVFQTRPCVDSLSQIFIRKRCLVKSFLFKWSMFVHYFLKFLNQRFIKIVGSSISQLKSVF